MAIKRDGESMENMEDLLQDRLELLEAGESLAVCKEGLPEELAEVLEFAAAMREVTVPQQTADTILAQRQELLALASHSLTPIGEKVTIMERIRQWIQERSGFDWAVAAVLGPALLILVFAFFSGLFSSSEPTTLETAAPEAMVETTSEEVIIEAEQAVEPAAEIDASGEVASGSTAEPQEVAAASPLFDLYIPLFSSQSVPEAATAFLEDVQGLVEYQQFDGTWVQVAHGATVKPGYRIRTAAYSGATVRFRDGSTAEVAANSELSIDELNAQRPDEGFRTIVMTQWRGESEHHVAFRNDGGSRYEVKNPNGTGLARGTIFTVVVGPDDTAHYEVTEGRVDVTGVNVTVIVVAGQLTTIPAGAAPSEPAFMVSGEGEVTAMGEEWVIGGQTFKTDADTVIVGEPEISDYVSVEGHLAENGDRIADTITLLPENEDERFSIRGVVSAIGDESWTVSGTELTLAGDVLITGEIVEGDTVDVSGIIGDEGELIAETITLVDEEAPGLPFTFVGVVQSIGDESWDISGRTVVISDVTTIDEGLAAADTVQVTGWITPEGDWLANSITRYLDNEPQFTFTGVVESIDPWMVADISFEVEPWTMIGPDIEVDSEVRVSGIIDEDGTWIATSIELLDEEKNLIILIGTVDSIDPWSVDGYDFEVDANTVISGDIEVEDRVRVVLEILPDGSWLALSIEPFDDELPMACFTINTEVVSLNGNELVLEGWPVISLEGVVINGGELDEDAVIALTICILEDGTIIVDGEVSVITVIIIIYTPPVNTEQPGGGGEAGGSGGTVCHRPPGNPDKAKTLHVGPGAVEAHLAHGDTLGPCN